MSLRLLVSLVCLLLPGGAFAALNCHDVRNTLDLTVAQDGGEETLTVRRPGALVETFLVIYHDSVKIVAETDSALYGPSSRGAILSFNTYGKNYLAYNGDLIEVRCQNNSAP